MRELLTTIADIIHENNYLCSAARTGAECEDCLKVADQIAAAISANTEAAQDMLDLILIQQGIAVPTQGVA